MAESTISGDFGGGIPISCILDEGAPTVTARTYGPGGTFETGLVHAAELRKGDPVALSVETSNTYIACAGMPVVERVSNGDDMIIGMIVSEPSVPVATPATSALADSLTKRLAGKYYRKATVEIWGGITAIRTAHLKTADAVAVTPGGLTLLDLDVSQSIADHDLVLNDIAGGAGAGYMPFHYQAKVAGADVTILVGMVALGTAAT
jgi:hypothetical protein